MKIFKAIDFFFHFSKTQKNILIVKSSNISSQTGMAQCGCICFKTLTVVLEFIIVLKVLFSSNILYFPGIMKMKITFHLESIEILLGVIGRFCQKLFLFQQLSQGEGESVV